MKTLSLENPLIFRRVTRRSACPRACALAAILLIAFSAMAQQTPGGSDPADSSAKERAEHQAAAYEGAVKIVERLRHALERAKAEREEILSRQSDLRRILVEHQLLPESVSEVMAALAMDLIEIEVQMYGKQGRIKSIERAIAVQADLSREEAGRDDVLKKMEQIVALRHAAMKRTERAHQSQVVSDAERERAQADLAEAELRVAMRKSELAASDGTASLAALNEQLRSTTIDLAELEAQREYISKRLEDVRPLIELGIEHDRLAKSDLQRAERKSRDLENRLQLAEEKAEYFNYPGAKSGREQAKHGDSSDGASSKD